MTTPADYAAAYAGAGLIPLRIPAGEKRPLESGWQATPQRSPDDARAAMNGHRGNIGCTFPGDLFALDIDTKGADGFAALAALEDRHGPLPATLTQKTPSGGEHRLFRKPAGLRLGNRTGFAPGLDIRETGGQIVVEPSQVGGRPYAWQDWEPLSGEAPEIAEAPAWLLQEIGAHAATPEGTAPKAAVHVPEITRQELRAALMYVDPDPRDTWVAVGHALAELGEAGRELWVEWSQRSPKWQESDAATWQTFKPAATGYQAVFARAQAAGWINPLSKTAGAVGRQTAPHSPKVLSAADLLAKEFPALRWCVPDILPEGTYLLSAKPKVGKSWLALQIALAISRGGSVLSRNVDKGAALVLALEDNQRRIKSRLERLGAYLMTDAGSLSNLQCATDWSRVDQGGADDIERWLKDNPSARLVVIDTLARFRPATASRNSAYEQDYAAMAQIKRLSDAYGVTIIVVTHNRKMAADGDALDMISGTLGLSGGCDGALVIDRKRGSSEATLHLIGRDIENDGAFTIRFRRESCTWEMLGASAEVGASRERRELMDLFNAERRPLSPKEVAELTGRKDSTVRRLLSDMAKAGNLEREDGLYFLPGHPPVTPEHPEQGGRTEQHAQQEHACAHTHGHPPEHLVEGAGGARNVQCAHGARGARPIAKGGRDES